MRSLTVITVDRPEPEVKVLARDFAEAYGLAQVPTLHRRFAASAVRAVHITEQLFLPGRQVDWVGAGNLRRLWARRCLTVPLDR